MGLLYNPFGFLDDIFTTVKYAVTDQEKEGREAGIKAAAEIYKPILQELEYQKTKIIRDMEQEQSHFEDKVKLLREQCASYEKKAADISVAINQMRGRSAALDDLISTMSIGGIQSAFNTPISLGGGLGALLQKKMDEKREKYYQIELKEKSMEWQSKINIIRKKIAESINSLKSMKSSNQAQIQYVSKMVDDAIEAYCEKKAQYNFLSEMG